MRPEVGLCVGASLAALLLLPLVHPLCGQPPASTRSASSYRPAAPAPHTPSGAARHEGYRRLMEALRTNHQDAEAIEDWDPGAAPGGNDLVWRAQLLASDRTGALHRSWSAVNRARSLARTPDEIFRALELRARVECDLQWHTQELADARRLVSLRPDSLDSLLILRRAALCNQLPGLAKQVAARKAALEQTREHP